MKKILFILFGLSLISGCSRDFIVSESGVNQTNYLELAGYNSQGIEVEPANNWTLGETDGIKNYDVFVNIKKIPSVETAWVFNFKFGTTELYADSLDKWVSYANNLMPHHLENVGSIDVIGYTDSVGSSEVNLKLSEDRADYIKKLIVDYYLNKGLEAPAINAVGKYYLDPVADNDTDAGRMLNRRVEVHFNE